MAPVGGQVSPRTAMHAGDQDYELGPDLLDCHSGDINIMKYHPTTAWDPFLAKAMVSAKGVLNN